MLGPLVRVDGPERSLRRLEVDDIVSRVALGIGDGDGDLVKDVHVVAEPAVHVHRFVHL